MSYSFKVKGATKMAAIVAVHEHLDIVVKNCPEHAADRHQIINAVSNFVGLMEEDETRDVEVAVNGSIYKTSSGVRQVSCTVAVGLATRE